MSNNEIKTDKIFNFFKISLKKRFIDLSKINPIPKVNEITSHFHLILACLVEVYHYFKFKLTQYEKRKNSNYNSNYWKNIKNVEEHIKSHIFLISDILGKIIVKSFI
jgi:hypothetical protein